MGIRQRAAFGGAAALALILGALFLYGYRQDPANANPEYAEWPPTPADIISRIGTATAPAPEKSDSERRSEFCTLFKSRYRRHDPAVAIGVRFITATRIKLMCQPRLEPYLIDRIALSLWREAGEGFGQPIDIDIYDTFIGTRNIKIGQLRGGDEKPPIAHISYDYSTLDLLTHPPKQEPAPAAHPQPHALPRIQERQFGPPGPPDP